MIGRYISEALGWPILPEGGHQCFDAGGVEIETGDMLYALVRVTKPLRILETGTRFGVAAAFMGLALRDNGRGLLTTIEINPDSVNTAKRNMQTLGIAEYVQCLSGDACRYPATETFDMLFLDSELQFRFGDAVRWWPNLRDGGLLVIHDLHRGMSQDGPSAYGTLPGEIWKWVATGELQSLHLATPRGLYVGQKAHPRAYTTRILRGEA